MAQKQIPLPTGYDDDFINIFKQVITMMNNMGYTYEESLQKAHDILDEAEQTNDMNESVQQQINTLIAESGTSDAELLQARTDSKGETHSVLKERLDISEEFFTSELDRKASKVFRDSIVFKSGDDFGSQHFRIPFMATTKHGTIIAGGDVRYNGGSDWGRIDIGASRSVDGGKTWQDKQVVIKNNDISSEYSRAMDGCIIYDASEDKLYIFSVKLDDEENWFLKEDKVNIDVVYSVSEDDGVTWSEETSIKSIHDKPFMPGVGSGIVMQNGTIVLPAQTIDLNDPAVTSARRIRSTIVYSNDKGQTWHIGSALPERSSECNVVELDDGVILLNARQEGGSDKRALFTTHDMGNTWTPLKSNRLYSENRLFQTYPTMGSMIKTTTSGGMRKILFSHPYNETNNRDDITLLHSESGENWKPAGTILEGHSQGYSCIATNSEQTELYALLETGDADLMFRDITKLLPLTEPREKIVKTLENTRQNFFISNDGSDGRDGTSNSEPLKTFEEAFNRANTNNSNEVRFYILTDLDEKLNLNNVSEASQIRIIGSGGVRKVKGLETQNCPSHIIFQDIYSEGLTSVNQSNVEFRNPIFESLTDATVSVAYSTVVFSSPTLKNSDGSSRYAIKSAHSQISIKDITLEDNFLYGVEAYASTAFFSDPYDETSNLFVNATVPLRDGGGGMVVSNQFRLKATEHLNGWGEHSDMPITSIIKGNSLIVEGAALIDDGTVLTNGTRIAKLNVYKPDKEIFGVAVGNISAHEKEMIMVVVDSDGYLRLGQDLSESLRSIQILSMNVDFTYK